MSKKKQRRIRCSPCELDYLAAEYIKVCSKIGKRKECKILKNKYIEEKITANKLFKEVRTLIRGDKKALKALDVIDKLVEEKE
jgi:hypothetical protein